MAAAQINPAKSANGAAPGASAIFSPKAAAAAWRAAVTLPATTLVETLRFASRRLEAQADLLSSLLACQDAGQALEAQSHFVRNAVTEYEREAEAMMSKVRAATPDQAADGARRP